MQHRSKCATWAMGIVALLTMLLSCRDAHAGTLFSDEPLRLLTNEYSVFNPNDPDARRDDNWWATAGSLFLSPNGFYTGIPDTVEPDAASSNGTGSAVARYITRREFSGSLIVDVDLNKVALYNNGAVPPGIRGIHIWPRLQFQEWPSKYVAYVVTVSRASKHAVIKRKYAPDREDYYEVSPYVSFVFPEGRFVHTQVIIKNLAGGAVYLALYVEGKKVVEGTDYPRRGYPKPLTSGAIGIRGDGCEFYFKEVTVNSL